MQYATKEELLRKASFKCPIGRNQADCDGHPCPHRDDNIFDDYFSECVDSLYARAELMELKSQEVLKTG
jgi:hypothetical protein